MRSHGVVANLIFVEDHHESQFWCFLKGMDWVISLFKLAYGDRRFLKDLFLSFSLSKSASACVVSIAYTHRSSIEWKIEPRVVIMVL